MTSRDPVALSAAIEPVLREVTEEQHRQARYFGDAYRDGYSTQHAQQVLDTWIRTAQQRGWTRATAYAQAARHLRE